MDQPQSIWRVVRVEDSTLFGGASGITASKKITVQLATDGSTFQLEVPVSQFNAINLRGLIEQRVADELEVRNLSGGGYQESQP